MISLVIPVVLLWATCRAEDYYYRPQNLSRTTLSGIAAYRSALTLDWLAAEDHRQRELAAAFETEPSPPMKTLSTECIAYARPASGKVARLMLELLKNLEGDDGTIVTDLIQSLIRTKLLVETSMLDAEPDLDSLVKTPGVMMGEPHTTFPRILAMTWMTVTDPVTTKKFGWCPINRVNKYLAISKPIMIAKHMKALEPVIARARFIMEEFIQHVTPLNIYQKKPPEPVPGKTMMPRERSPSPPEEEKVTEIKLRSYQQRQSRTPATIRTVYLELAQSGTTPTPLIEDEPMPMLGDTSNSGETRTSAATRPQCLYLPLCHYLLTTIVLDLYVINAF